MSDQLTIEHTADCISFEDDDFCDCDFWDRLESDQDRHDREFTNE